MRSALGRACASATPRERRAREAAGLRRACRMAESPSTLPVPLMVRSSSLISVAQSWLLRATGGSGAGVSSAGSLDQQQPMSACREAPLCFCQKNSTWGCGKNSEAPSARPHRTLLIKIPVWWRRAVLPSLLGVGVFFLSFSPGGGAPALSPPPSAPRAGARRASTAQVLRVELLPGPRCSPRVVARRESESQSDP